FKKIGKFSKANKTAYNNLSLAFPNLSDGKKQQILENMWGNLGRVAGEFPHISKLDSEKFNQYVEHVNYEQISKMFKEKQQVILISAHFGNWELLMRSAYELDFPIYSVYRSANNYFIDKYIQNNRAQYQIGSIAKGKNGAKYMIKKIKEKQSIGMLVDQKMNDGISVPFFNRPAMTAPAVANLALKYNIPIIPIRVLRLQGFNFQIEAFDPIKYDKTGNQSEDAYNIMLQINNLLEKWITEYPEQWFWVHNRWPKSN
ncbi:MAG: lysophospholipid acyltransferase family protein, partial [Pseudomonadota bacterium]